MTVTAIEKDQDVRRKIQVELEWDPRVDASGIHVGVKEGIATLTGAVESYAKKIAARDAVHRVVGVLDVVDELQVTPSSAAKTDQELARAVRQSLEWDVYVPDPRIRSTVSEGWVTLEGDVDGTFERDAASRAIERLAGVRGVTNRILVKPKSVHANQIRASIEDALARQTQREAKRIKIGVDAGVVHLTGTVRSWAEKNAIEHVARYSEGVRRVENELVVDSYS
jgi:osmotically-inducible protein OsmY